MLYVGPESRRTLDLGGRAGIDLRHRNMARVRILATGGTIAGQAPSATDMSYSPSRVSVAALIGSVRGLSALAEISGEQVAQIASQDMNDARWLELGVYQFNEPARSFYEKLGYVPVSTKLRRPLDTERGKS